jgi:hypothetical protein
LIAAAQGTKDRFRARRTDIEHFNHMLEKLSFLPTPMPPPAEIG